MMIEMALAVAAMSPGPGRTEFTHGSDIIARCTDTSPQGGSFCFGFIAATYETVRAYETWLNVRELCMPADTTLADMRDVVVARITKFPDDRLGQGASVVVNALKTKWPCVAAAPQTPAPAPSAGKGVVPARGLPKKR